MLSEDATVTMPKRGSFAETIVLIAAKQPPSFDRGVMRPRPIGIGEIRHQTHAKQDEIRKALAELVESGVLVRESISRWALTGTFMFQDYGKGYYLCGDTQCGYTGRHVCQNCGYAKGERDNLAAFGTVA